MRIFGLYIGRASNIDRLEDALHSSNRKVRQHEQKVDDLQAVLNNANEKLNAIEIQAIYTRDALKEVSRLIDYRNGEAYKQTNPKQRAQWLADLAKAYEKASEQLYLLQKSIRGL